MFKNASATPHDFYHLLSGVDLPLKPISEIHDFFDHHKDKLFVDLTPDTEYHRKRIEYCINYYHFFMHFSRSWIGKIIGHLHIPQLFIVFQKMLGVSRMKNDGTFKMCKGYNWMSLPEDAVRYLINQEDYIKHRFRYTCCADEIFALSIFMNSPFKSRFYQENENECRNGALREIDWQRGNPYTWTMEDLQLLQKSNNLFARKFSTKKDKEIIDYIKENV